MHCVLSVLRCSKKKVIEAWLWRFISLAKNEPAWSLWKCKRFDFDRLFESSIHGDRFRISRISSSTIIFSFNSIDRGVEKVSFNSIKTLTHRHWQRKHHLKLSIFRKRKKDILLAVHSSCSSSSNTSCFFFRSTTPAVGSKRSDHGLFCSSVSAKTTGMFVQTMSLLLSTGTIAIVDDGRWWCCRRKTMFATNRDDSGEEND